MVPVPLPVGREDEVSGLGVSVARLINNSSTSANGSCCIPGVPRDVGTFALMGRGSPTTALRDFVPACFGMTILYVRPLAIDRSVSEKRTLRLLLQAAALSGAAGSGKNRASRELHAI